MDCKPCQASRHRHLQRPDHQKTIDLMLDVDLPTIQALDTSLSAFATRGGSKSAGQHSSTDYGRSGTFSTPSFQLSLQPRKYPILDIVDMETSLVLRSDCRWTVTDLIACIRPEPLRGGSILRSLSFSVVWRGNTLHNMLADCLLRNRTRGKIDLVSCLLGRLRWLRTANGYTDECHLPTKPA